MPFDTYHRDDQPDAVRAAIGDGAPAVVAETVDGIVPVLDSAGLAECRGSIEALVEAVEHKLAKSRPRLANQPLSATSAALLHVLGVEVLDTTCSQLTFLPATWRTGSRPEP